MWVSVALAVLVELVPAEVRTTAVASYFFIISNIGGNMPLLVPPVKTAFINAGYGEVDSLRSKILNLLWRKSYDYHVLFNLCRYSLFILPWRVHFGCFVVPHLAGRPSS